MLKSITITGDDSNSSDEELIHHIRGPRLADILTDIRRQIFRLANGKIDYTGKTTEQVLDELSEYVSEACEDYL